MLDDSFINYCLSTGAAVPSDWRAIIRDNPDQEKTFAEAKRLVLALHGGLSRMEVNRQIEMVRQHLRQRDNDAVEKGEDPGPLLSTAFVVTGSGRIRKRILKKIIALCAVLCIVIAGWLLFVRPANSLLPGKVATALVRVYKTQAGQRQEVTLPDGSEVILNANSEVSVAADFNDSKREVWLSGNAFFKVAKNAEHVFMVHAANVTTIAVGTEFYVHNSKIDEAVQVDLLEGKVRLKDTRKTAVANEITLLPGETGKSTSSEFVKERFDADYLRRWIGGRITFNETPVLHAIKQLETWFGTKIDVKKTGLEGRMISGEYQGKSLQEILGVICFSIGCNFTFGSDSVITIK